MKDKIKNAFNHISEKEILKEYNEKNIKASLEDMELDNLIKYDMGIIWNEVGGQDGMYENFPIIRFFRSEEKGEPHRAYALSSGGGIAIFVYNLEKESYTRWKIVTLGEDDAYHFLNSANMYCSLFGNKQEMLSLVSEAISVINNNI